MTWINDLLNFLFPVNCLVCGKRLGFQGDVLCLACEYNLPRTGYKDRPDNPVNRLFWGRVPIESGTSMFRFEKGSAYQTLLHELKYRGNQKTGKYLGRLLAQELMDTSFAKCDLLVPVPLHPKRLRKRGYNQSEVIAMGFSDVLGIPVETNLIRRVHQRLSQTSLGRFDRFSNVSDNFLLTRSPPDISGLEILLIDDVVTTGATLEACSQLILNHFKCSVSVATVSSA